jgi:cytochrome c oxidase cbb3-type subunit III
MQNQMNYRSQTMTKCHSISIWMMRAASVAVVTIASLSTQAYVHAASSPAASPALAHYLQASNGMMAQAAQAKAPAPAPVEVPKPSKEAEAGGVVFMNNCAFCHGRDAAGGESGPDLTRDKLVADDKDGDKIIPVVRNGRANTAMPAFSLNDTDMQNLQAFIHYRALVTATQKGGRRGVDVSDLQTGNAADGKAFFEGAGGCNKCHSATGDLAGIANRYEGLALEMHMLYPVNARTGGSHAKVTVTTADGKTVTGIIAYRDDFTIGLHDSNGVYHSWSTSKAKYTIDDPVQAHIDLFPKYTDKNVHDLFAYIETLK